MTRAPGPDPVAPVLAAIRALGDGPEPAPDDRLVAFLAERAALAGAAVAPPGGDSAGTDGGDPVGGAVPSANGPAGRQPPPAREAWPDGAPW